MRMLRTILLVGILALVVSGVAAQGDIPPTIPGEAVYIPLPVSITVDGDLADWADVPSVTVETGPYTSDDPAENGSFTFAVAAEDTTFYIYMTMPDQNIITGQHGADYWNEDSLEFYLNVTGDRWAETYAPGIVQYRFIPADIGKTDLAEMTLGGQNVDSVPISEAAVFATEGGWGFEAAIPLADWVTPAHGVEIGFQAQANGATEQDRDVKLIWSTADTGDNSWNNASLFGAGLFFELGQSDVPLPSEPGGEPEATMTEEAAPPAVRVNQVGYLPAAQKLAMLETEAEGTAEWALTDVATGEVVATGVTSETAFDAAAGASVQVADFSEWTTPGTYTLAIGEAASVPFVIGSDIYADLIIDAARYFYLNRSGLELVADYAGEWARSAGHVTDNDVTCYSGTANDGSVHEGCDYRLDASGGWYDAGDYGKYVVNGGISLWTLLNLYERQPDAYPDGALNIPESGNGVPDILDEARWEMEWILSMQVPAGEPLAGMAHHKLHDLTWAGMPVMPPTEWDNDNPSSGRYLMPPSTAATLNLAATAAQCARIWAELDPAFAEQCLTAAEAAWTAAQANPSLLYGDIPGNGGGNYGDGYVADDFFWAAAELYITTGSDDYYMALADSNFLKRFPGADKDSAMGWPDTGALGTISLLSVSNGLSEDEITGLEGQIVETADLYLGWMAAEPYDIPLRPTAYYWGSNSSVLNNAIILALAYDLTGDDAYLNGVTGSFDYILGRNPLNFSYVTGYGTYAPEHPHHRFWGNRPSQGFPPPPPGVVVGGPLADPAEDTTRNNAILDAGAAKRYVDMIEAYSSNEVTINWNAPLTWVVAYLDAVGE